jgi:hypothetical protein
MGTLFSRQAVTESDKPPQLPEYKQKYRGCHPSSPAAPESPFFSLPFER